MLYDGGDSKVLWTEVNIKWVILHPIGFKKYERVHQYITINEPEGFIHPTMIFEARNLTKLMNGVKS